jgi:inner membrane protein
MFIAHAPAGYLLTTALRRCERYRDVPLAVGLVASVFPDVDLLWFYLVDHSRPHHVFWTHWPAAWLVLGAIACGITSLIASLSSDVRPEIVSWCEAFVINVLVAHLVPDTLCGGIHWFAPWSQHSYWLVTVPARHAFWIANFADHWTALVELAIVCAAIALYYREKTLTADRRAGAAPR